MTTRPIRPAASLLALAAGGLMAGTALADFNDTPPNGAAFDQTPAFENQTRAPVIQDDITLTQTVVAEGLEHPWGLAALPDGAWLLTERPGRMRLVAADGTLSDPISGLPEVDARGQGGLHDVSVSDDFAETRRVWWTYAEPRGDGTNATAIATGTLSADGSAMENVERIWQQQPAASSNNHFGARILHDGEGHLIVGLGERSDRQYRDSAQDPATTLGKVIRISAADGSPAGSGIEGAAPEVWTTGHRNIQGAAVAPDGRIWMNEHGPKGGDELNLIEPGLNYGWPVIAYGTEYSGGQVGEGLTAQDGMQQPNYYWDPSPAISGMAFYDGEMFPDWQGSALIGGMRSGDLIRLTLDGDRVTGEARYLDGIGRVREVEVAADGALMIITDHADGKLIRVSAD
ncbi:MAG: PQQ-dependent sugar dehydrogenase [Paracoccus sp. (in: a-proteobacteria)]|uniref:PQQ-dependent sugar dehydrogenase n=1 Tax=Paracoccus sp. TaxID=267 RepID=UPI0026E0C662|nr:PQQ-dependent sugar dehydrogenase [Paracoccus sp. (in: a-proteobacteria)]MDO5612635.1 PQQ-dependent sugar dehydrogenase [Paracoccus sp. (in: a-proteobacteria)]